MRKTRKAINIWGISILAAVMLLCLVFGTSVARAEEGMEVPLEDYAELSGKLCADDKDTGLPAYVENGQSLFFQLAFCLEKTDGSYLLRKAYQNGEVDPDTTFTVDISFLNILESANYPTSFDDENNIVIDNGKEIFRWWVDEANSKICLRFYENVYVSEGDVSNTKIDFAGTLNVQNKPDDGKIVFSVADTEFTQLMKAGYTLTKAAGIPYYSVEASSDLVDYTVTLTLDQTIKLSAGTDEEMYCAALTLVDTVAVDGALEGLIYGDVEVNAPEGETATVAIARDGAVNTLTISSPDHKLNKGTYIFTYKMKIDSAAAEAKLAGYSDALKTNTIELKENDASLQTPLTATAILEYVTEIRVTKAWQNADGTTAAPEDAMVVFTLYADGNATDYTVTLDGTANTAPTTTGGYESEAWTASFVKLPLYQADGTKEIAYTVAETQGYAGYVASPIEPVENDEIITNTQVEGGVLGGYSVSLSDNIDMKFYMELDASVLADADAYIQFDMQGKEPVQVKVNSVGSPVKKYGRDYYVFTYGVAAKEMADTITAQIFYSDGNGGTKSGIAYEYSVKEYIEALLEKNTNEKEMALAKAMLNYGGYAQTYFGHNADNLANKEYADNTLAITITDLEIYVPEVIDNSNIFTYAGSTLLLETEIKVRHYFKLKDGQSYSGNELKLYEAQDQDTLTGTYYYWESDGIPAARLGEAINYTGVNDISISYSPLSYVTTVVVNKDQELKENESLQNLMKALYLYYQAVVKYNSTN